MGEERLERKVLRDTFKSTHHRCRITSLDGNSKAINEVGKGFSSPEASLILLPRFLRNFSVSGPITPVVSTTTGWKIWVGTIVIVFYTKIVNILLLILVTTLK